MDALKASLIQEVKELFGSSKSKRFGMTSLSSVIKDWCETLDGKVFEQLFPDGTEKCLLLFRSVTNDEDTFVARLAKVATDLFTTPACAIRLSIKDRSSGVTRNFT